MSQLPQDLRAEIDRLVAAKDVGAAPLLAELWRAQPTSATAGFVVGRYERLREQLPLAKCRLYILRSFTVETIVPLARAMAFAAGIDLETQVGDFNAHAQEILDPSSRLYQFEPDAVVLALQTSDVSPAIWKEFAGLDAAAVQAEIDRVSGEIVQLMQAFRQRSGAALIVHGLQSPPTPAMGILDAQQEVGQREAVQRINRLLGQCARRIGHAYMLDYDALISRRGDDGWRDERLWLTVRMPVAPGEMIHLAREWMRFIHPITGKLAKVLVLDLDNTLWGGVIGEDGIDGIKLGADFPGAAWQRLQRAALDLYHRGILLAICSKNNQADAMEALEKHPGMLLRPEHFAAMRINWEDKASNLRQIAKELNLGIDSLAFVDDNPAERRWVRSQVPEAMVLDLPADPMQYARALRDWPVFERLRLTEEDRVRAGYYAQDRLRNEMRGEVTSLEEFYRSLKMRATVARMTPATLPRCAQLTQKTNQFNLTTRRYSEEQMARMSAEETTGVYALSASDRFGDNGLVGLAILHFGGTQCEIDTLLLSCRVIGRTIETALLATLAAHARSKGAERLIGWFVATKKNAPAKNFYRSHGFTLQGEDGGMQTWELPLADNPLRVPEWVEVTFTA